MTNERHTVITIVEKDGRNIIDVHANEPVFFSLDIDNKKMRDPQDVQTIRDMSIAHNAQNETIAKLSATLKATQDKLHEARRARRRR